MYLLFPRYVNNNFPYKIYSTFKTKVRYKLFYSNNLNKINGKLRAEDFRLKEDASSIISLVTENQNHIEVRVLVAF